MTNKANIVGLGMVTHRSEVASNNPDQPTHLEVTVLHHDWSSKVIDVSVTSGHHIGKQNPVASTSIVKSAGDGRTIPANPKIPKVKENFSSPSPSSSKANGKRKANEPKLQETDKETDSESNQSQSDQSPDEAPPPAKKG
ncbi:hypothetical protein PtA15_7A547 [Puccinia triticina]|uniref:Uncharacterized protein n=1 Tax=Puccinia triticina TaxID=208348 RepID=A0ABY7CR69_9BASI|nr:uncharacterized protein PtA15_7A547 [Puccinia triticina]WAQ86818.1 hypothetical protein PtA15_7A547 [Puccinia triticina]